MKTSKDLFRALCRQRGINAKELAENMQKLERWREMDEFYDGIFVPCVSLATAVERVQDTIATQQIFK